jgi:hypothetical protein
MHDDIMHDGIWCIDILPFQYTQKKKKKQLPILLGIFIA